MRIKLIIIMGCLVLSVGTAWAGKIVIKSGKMVVRGPVVIRQ